MCCATTSLGSVLSPFPPRVEVEVVLTPADGWTQCVVLGEEDEVRRMCALERGVAVEVRC